MNTLVFLILSFAVFAGVFLIAAGIEMWRTSLSQRRRETQAAAEAVALVEHSVARNPRHTKRRMKVSKAWRRNAVQTKKRHSI